MEENRDNFGFGENMPEPEEIIEEYAITDGSDTLEPYVEEDENREINTDDDQDIQYWANEFQISVDDLKAAVVINGNSVREIKKYLSV